MATVHLVKMDVISVSINLSALLVPKAFTLITIFVKIAQILMVAPLAQVLLLAQLVSLVITYKIKVVYLAQFRAQLALKHSHAHPVFLSIFLIIIYNVSLV